MVDIVDRVSNMSNGTRLNPKLRRQSEEGVSGLAGLARVGRVKF